MALFINSGGEPEDNEIIGIAYDVKQTQSGYTFSLDDTDGSTMRCFARTEPVEFEVYIIRGELSDDGGIFFVDTIRAVSEKEF